MTRTSFEESGTRQDLQPVLRHGFLQPRLVAAIALQHRSKAGEGTA